MLASILREFVKHGIRNNGITFNLDLYKSAEHFVGVLDSCPTQLEETW